MVSSREGLESCQDFHSHAHCASGYENGSAIGFDLSGDGAGGVDYDHWSENTSPDDNDGLAP